MSESMSLSRFLTKQLQIGLVGYLYNQATCDGGSGDQVGCFQSRVPSVGGQLGYTIPMGALEGNVNVRAYKEFAAANRREGWNVWPTYTISPADAAPAQPTAPPRRRHEIARSHRGDVCPMPRALALIAASCSRFDAAASGRA